jgi:hypothetical protein
MALHTNQEALLAVYRVCTKIKAARYGRKEDYMKRAILVIGMLLAFAGVTPAQQIYCYTVGNQTYCNQQHNGYEEGRKIGESIGRGVAVQAENGRTRRAERSVSLIPASSTTT